MVIWHGEKGKKRTGGKITGHRKKRVYELGGFPTPTTIGRAKKKYVRTKGGGVKQKAVSAQFANVYDPKVKGMKKVKILSVESNEANPHLVRRGIITKGTVVKTEIGNARITSRPSQDGIVSAKLVEE